VIDLDDYAEHDGVGLAALIRAGELTPEEAVMASLAAIESLNPQLNAVTRILADDALSAARGPLPDGPFRGVPFLVKDLIVSMAGIPTECGSRFFKGWSRAHDSEIIKRWKASGLVIVGKTNTPELGSSGSTEPIATGATHNPWHRDHTPGGSSGGSAAAVASGIVPMAHANDAGGSIRGPASCCGLVGLKPTRGRNSLGPDAGEYWSGLVVEHIVSRSLRDTAALLDCTAGAVAGDPYIAPLPERPYLEELTREPGCLKIGLATEGPAGMAFDADCLRAVTETARTLEQLGHQVEIVSPRWDTESLGEAVMDIFAAATAWDIEDRAVATGVKPSNELLENTNLWLWERGRRLDAIGLLRATRRLNEASRSFASFFEDHDIWMTPTMAQLPPKLGYLDSNLEDAEQFFERLWRFNPFNSIYNATGLPAITLPLHMSASGLPVGIMLGARFGGEDVLMRLSAQLETAHPWQHRHPSVSLWP